MKNHLFIGTAAAVAFAAGLAHSAQLSQPGSGKPGPAIQSQALPAIADFGGEKAVTRSSRDATLAFPFPAEIAEILVRGGQPVKKGDLILRARDEEYRYQRDLQKLLADSDLDVQKAQAALDQAKVELDAQTELREKKMGGNKVEFDRARLTHVVKQVELEIARNQLEQQKMQLKFREAQLDRNYLRAPFDGRVDEVVVDVGDVKKDSEKVARVVSVNPLWIDVPTPTAQTITLGLKNGDPAWAVLDMPGDPVVSRGKVIEVGAEADPASNTRRVRVELPNPNEHPGGLTAWVRFQPPRGRWAERLAPEGPVLTAEKPR
jgi:RND family efflux transporter MFP subunit